MESGEMGRKYFLECKECGWEGQPDELKKESVSDNTDVGYCPDCWESGDTEIDLDCGFTVKYR